MKAYGGVDVQIRIYLTSALVGREWSASRPDRFTPGGRAPGTHWIGGWVDPRDVENNIESPEPNFTEETNKAYFVVSGVF
jgi:hypothetical protein